MFLRPRDLVVFETIERHGPLSSLYLYQFTKDVAHDRLGFTRRLKALTEEGYLERPKNLNHPLIFTDFKVYTLTEKGREALAGKLNQFATPVGVGTHGFMTACITANIELEVKKAGYRFISQEEILKAKTCPEATRQMAKPLSLQSSIAHNFRKADGSTYTHRSNRPTEPDQLFGIDYGNGFRFFALEADRGTEPLTRPDLNQNSILRKVLSYKDILIRGEYKKQWGIPNLYPLFITTAADRVDNMLDLTRTIYPNGSNFLLFKSISGFHQYLRTPPLIAELFTVPYKRTGDPFAISRP